MKAELAVKRRLVAVTGAILAMLALSACQPGYPGIDQQWACKHDPAAACYPAN